MQSWSNYSPVKRKPIGLIHVIYDNDNEEVIPSSAIDWDTGLNEATDAKLISYVSVDGEYTADFESGMHRV